MIGLPHRRGGPSWLRLSWRTAVGVALVSMVWACSSVRPPAQRLPAIQLPDMLAIELPGPGVMELSPLESPLKELLEARSPRGLKVTHDQTRPLPVGATRVTWTAWADVPGASPVEATRSDYVYVFPFGQTPVGVTGRYNATAGNHAPKLVRDSSGKLHVAWFDSGLGRPATVFYRRGQVDSSTARVTWETAAIPISDHRLGAGFVAMESSPNAVHFAWVGNNVTFYRRLSRVGTEWRWEPIRYTGATGGAHDNGSDIAVRGDDEIHLLTYAGQYAVSTNAGAGWKVERLAAPHRGAIKNPALAVDSLGNAHIVYTALTRHVPESKSKGSGGYWELRYVRRMAKGGWVDGHAPLAQFEEWADGGMKRDVLADWSDVAVDRTGNVHVVWHGTGRTGVYSQDEAFYARRPSTGNGAWGPWEPPQALRPVNRALRHGFSFAPSLSLHPDAHTVVAVLFFETTDLPREIYDSDAVLLRDGKAIGTPIALARSAQAAADRGVPHGELMSTWFPCAAPSLHRDPNGRIWLDVVQTSETPERRQSVHYIVYQRADLTDALAALDPDDKPVRRP